MLGERRNEACQAEDSGLRKHEKQTKEVDKSLKVEQYDAESNP